VQENENKTILLNKDPKLIWVIKDLGIDPKSVFNDTKILEEMSSETPDIRDQSQAQRQLIYYLFNKVKNEEKQRLETEEQSSKVIGSLEKTLSQMDERLRIYENNSKNKDCSSYSDHLRAPTSITNVSNM
jgi:hypothetical protein